ncbi:MAG: hypothetical protein CL696_01285 [Chloroflexi bacterium]|jgi:hypothetical protein|uniref:Uncharacterized protein n=1 Tax=marine metagenome TaxID=408172 RepID=A0A382HPU5_9ZZZZ|nr:hypothetical protein [Chloroflexota bacterium]MDP6497529.1 hypothetical protein [Dehalococcoidia bacterium]MQF89901.1 hypothetical protein [SAR202 cluster bacterium]MDP7587984.1 hypothetical protein [Dehalococcoidia bacterium]MQG11724.1 hypothetical protein [SAR202 cluster bacterium]|tara:strand:+ start:9785 stop:10027 length:243 start_codon:yes stop_codon:yes gene_type:complete
MLKADRDQIMENQVDDDRKQFRQFIDDYRAKRKAVSGGQMPAREMLDAGGRNNLTGGDSRPYHLVEPRLTLMGRRCRTSI